MRAHSESGQDGRTIALLLIVFAWVAIGGCSSGAMRSLGLGAPAIKAPPDVVEAEKAGFLPDPARMTPDSRYPFQVSWVAPGVNLRSYSKVILAPVSLEHLRATDQSGAAIDNQKAAVDAAVLAGEAFTRAVQDAAARHLTIATRPDAKTIVIDMAIVELTPNVLPATTGMLAMPGLASAAEALTRESNHEGRGTIAMEFELRDGQTDQVIAMFADRRRAKAPSGNEKITPGYGFTGPILAVWMRRTVAMLGS